MVKNLSPRTMKMLLYKVLRKTWFIFESLVLLETGMDPFKMLFRNIPSILRLF